tara:strand:+ start:705 stop:962 length:258 start_codon:yes stop_codon:yes gene_type:complete
MNKYNSTFQAEVYEDMPHVFQFFGGLVEDTRIATERYFSRWAGDKTKANDYTLKFYYWYLSIANLQCLTVELECLCVDCQAENSV